jgi:hypothetical protein
VNEVQVSVASLGVERVCHARLLRSHDSIWDTIARSFRRTDPHLHAEQLFVVCVLQTMIDKSDQADRPLVPVT